MAAAGCGKTDDRPYVWSYLSPAIFQPTCATASCHSRGAAVSGLDFSTPERGYRSLTGLHTRVVTAAQNADGTCQQQGAAWLCPSARPLVVPYVPSESHLVAMLRGQNAPLMPPDRPLPEPDIRLIEAWILNGATETGGVASPFDAGGVGDLVARESGASDGAAGAAGAAGGGAGNGGVGGNGTTGGAGAQADAAATAGLKR